MRVKQVQSPRYNEDTCAPITKAFFDRTAVQRNKCAGDICALLFQVWCIVYASKHTRASPELSAVHIRRRLSMQLFLSIRVLSRTSQSVDASGCAYELK
eukprot:5863617-Pleurochrysis_carterae.AAC.1